MEYQTGVRYPLTEVESISEWWKTHRQYDVNEYEDGVEIVRRDTEIVADDIRERRKYECFPVINRGQLWYNKLTEAQKSELDAWYQAWLDAPQTLTEPPFPAWLDEERR